MEKQNAKFKYVFEKDYNPMYVNGAFGSVSPNGEIVVNFYFERNAVPYEQKFALQDDGTLGECVETTPNDFKFIRYIQSGIVMNREDARSMANWLLGMLDETQEGLQ